MPLSGKTLIITSIGVSGVHVICCDVPRVVRLVGELLLTGKVAATFAGCLRTYLLFSLINWLKQQRCTEPEAVKYLHNQRVY